MRSLANEDSSATLRLQAADIAALLLLLLLLLQASSSNERLLQQL